MFSVYKNNVLFFDSSADLDEVSLTSAKLKIEAGKSGSFSFGVPVCNVIYDNINLSTDYVELYRNDLLIFSGRVYSVNKGFEGILNVECEGLLSILADSIFRPTTHDGSLTQLLQAILTSHNSQVGADKQISLGSIEPSDAVCYREYTNYETSIKRLNDLVTDYGGYLFLRKSNNGLFLDWLINFSEASDQTIDFGENLIDLEQEANTSDIITVLIPLGAEQEAQDGTKKRLTIESVNSGLDYLENATGIRKFGRIVGTETWDDVTDASKLKKKAKSFLESKVISKVSINATAADMSLIETFDGEDYSGGYFNPWSSADNLNGGSFSFEDGDSAYGGSFNWASTSDWFLVGSKVKVNSKVHGIENLYFDILTYDLDLFHPESLRVKLSTSEEGYVGQTQRRNSQYYNRIDNVIANYATNKQVNDLRGTVEEHTTLIEQNSEQIALKANERIIVNGQVTTAEAELNIQADEITQKVSKDGLISEINQSAEEIQINAEKININGVTSLNGYFSVDDEGRVEISGASKFEVETDGSDVSAISLKFGNTALYLSPGQIRMDVNGVTRHRFLNGIYTGYGTDGNMTIRWSTESGIFETNGKPFSGTTSVNGFLKIADYIKNIMYVQIDSAPADDFVFCSPIWAYDNYSARKGYKTYLRFYDGYGNPLVDTNVHGTYY